MVVNLRIAFILGSLVLGTACGGSDDKKPKRPVPSDTALGADDDDGGVGDEPPVASAANLGEVIYFEFDSSDLNEESRNTLEQNAEWLRGDEVRVLTIEGHTDEAGTPAYNLALGERRARAAKAFLTRLGIAETRVSIITYGEEKPAGSEDTLNRRSVFISSKK